MTFIRMDATKNASVRHTDIYKKNVPAVEKMFKDIVRYHKLTYYLCIRQAAPQQFKADFIASGLHCLCIRQAAPQQFKAGFIAFGLHCLCINKRKA